MWQHGVCDVQDAEEVRLKLCERGEGASLLEDGLDAVAGVVDDDVYAAPDGEGLLDALLHELGRVGDVELEEVEAGAFGCGEDCAELLEVAGCCDDAVAS